ncbi:GntR family transcriptional regulator [bacterium]|nr:GntR family transcriptional regulator [bacterium]MCI0606922.1 GntR family transcriptional regulator [bacterium]
MFQVRTGSGEPIYEQLIRQVKHAITTGVLKSGDQLPPVRELAVRLVINPNTVARAYRELEQIGLVESNTRRGTIVKFTPSGMLVAERRKRLQPFIDQLLAEAHVLNFTNQELFELVQDALKRYRKGKE